MDSHIWRSIESTKKTELCLPIISEYLRLRKEITRNHFKSQRNVIMRFNNMSYAVLFLMSMRDVTANGGLDE